MRADAREKRARLVRAARELIAEQGADVPLSTIAQRADVGIATLYRHFPTRDELVLGVVSDIHAQLRALLEHADEAWDADPETAWTGFVRTVAGLRLGTLAANLGDIFELPALREEGSRLRDDGMDRVGELLGRARAAGLVDETVTAERFQLGMATITRALPNMAVLVAADEYDWLVATYLKGLRP